MRKKYYNNENKIKIKRSWVRCCVGLLSLAGKDLLIISYVPGATYRVTLFVLAEESKGSIIVNAKSNLLKALLNEDPSPLLPRFPSNQYT